MVLSSDVHWREEEVLFAFDCRSLSSRTTLKSPVLVGTRVVDLVDLVETK